MTEVKGQEDGQGDVSGEEGGGGEFAGEEDLEAVGQSQEDEEYEGEVGQVGLEGGFVRAEVEGVLVGERFAETLGEGGVRKWWRNGHGRDGEERGRREKRATD